MTLNEFLADLFGELAFHLEKILNWFKSLISQE